MKHLSREHRRKQATWMVRRDRQGNSLAGSGLWLPGCYTLYWSTLQYHKSEQDALLVVVKECPAPFVVLQHAPTQKNVCVVS